MTVPQVHIYIGDRGYTRTNMQHIPRVGEWILYEDCYFPVKDVFHGLDGRVHVICHEQWHFIKDYKLDTYDKGVERFKTSIQVNAALKRGDLRVLKVGDQEEEKQ